MRGSAGRLATRCETTRDRLQHMLSTALAGCTGRELEYFNRYYFVATRLRQEFTRGGASRLGFAPGDYSKEATGGLLARVTRASPRAAPIALVACLLAAWLLENPIFKPVNYPCYPVQAFPPRQNIEAFHEAAAMIGPEDSVLATSAFAPQLSRRKQIGIIGWASQVAHPDVVCLDISDFRWTLWSGDYAGELERLILSPDYGVAYWRDGVVLLRRGGVDRVGRTTVVTTLRENAQAQP